MSWNSGWQMRGNESARALDEVAFGPPIGGGELLASDRDQLDYGDVDPGRGAGTRMPFG